MNKDLTSRVLCYMNDTSSRYAIALEGDWGSGKTLYCETELAECLHGEGFTLVRVSLFGVTNADEVYGRLVMAMVKLSTGDDEGRTKRFFKGLAALGAKTAISYGVDKLSDLGISLETPPQMLTGMLGGKQLLVFDDVERCDLNGVAKNSLYGVINDLIEAQGCKVMLVARGYDDIPAEIREKVVWRCYRFDPAPEDLVKSIILPAVKGVDCHLDFDVSKTVCDAAANVSCRNARAMIRSRKLFEMAVASESLANNQVDVENRRRAFSDFARYTFRVAMGDAPEEPLSNDDEIESAYDRFHKSIEYSSFVELSVIKDFFNPKRDVTEREIDLCLSAYIASHYAGSQETMALQRVLNDSRTLDSMDDDEVAALADRLSKCISQTTFDPALLNKAAELNVTLRGWGFKEALSDEELLSCAQKLVDIDIEEAWQKIHCHYVAWRADWLGRYAVLADIDSYIVEQYEKLRLGIEDSLDVGDPNAGQCFLKLMRKEASNDEGRLTLPNPEFVAKLFVNGNGPSQHAICEYIAGFKAYGSISAESKASEWGRSLWETLSNVTPGTIMGEKRLDWVLHDLADLLDGNEDA